MGLGHSPRIVTDGLVLALDAGNSKNYNVGISTNWTDKVGGNNGTLVNETYHTDGPFVGAGYVEFDGTYDHLTLSPGFTIGTGDFTVECWVYPISSNQKMEIWQNSSLIGGFYLSSNFNSADAGPILNRTSPPGSGWSTLLVGNTTLVASAWNHIAWVRQSGTIKMYLNGVQESNTLSSSIDSSTMGSIGAWSDGQYDLNGFISNLRIVKGTALYTSAFTPPTKPLTAVPNTVLLTCQGNAISDASSSALSITANGDAAANLGFPKSAFVFDGVNDYVTIGSFPNTTFDFGSGEFTLECWINISTFAAGGATTYGINMIYATGDSDVGSDFRFFITKDSTLGGYTTNGLYLSVNSTPIAIGAYSSFITNIWYHCAATRIGNNIYIFLNGSLLSTTSYASPIPNATSYQPSIGAVQYSGSFLYPLNGKISNTRVYKGKGLTAAEVEQNYRNTKGRYGL